MPWLYGLMEMTNGFHFHLGAGVQGAALRADGALRVDTAQGPLAADRLIFCTGFRTDWALRPEFNRIAPHVRLWQDRFTPAPGEEDEELAESPDLGPLYEFQERVPGSCPGLDRVHCFNYAAALSQGASAGDIPQISEGSLRLARGLAARLLAEDVAHHYANIQRYAEPELDGDEWTPAAFPAYEEAEEGRACIYELDLRTGQCRSFAAGLRNPVGLAWEPHTKALWTVVNERDGLGDETPPDYLTSVIDGGFYGWPYSYWGQTVDDRVPQDAALVARAMVPDYALGGHTASLGLCWMPGGTLPGFAEDGMVIGQHGSWNRSTLSGYKVVFVPFANGRPAGPPRDILGGFLAPDESESYGRPVGVALAADGSLLVADDVGDVVWRVAAARPG